jgi:hypothetical protein
MEPSGPTPTSGTCWLAKLAARGAAVEGQRVLHFGDPAAERLAARDDTIVCDLSHLGTITATGADAEAFLQGQLSNDVRQLGDGRAQFSSYNTPKGRMLACLLAYRAGAAICLQLPRDLVEPIRKRLAMFVLRSKVQLADATDARVRLGIAGTDAVAIVASAMGCTPGAVMSVTRADAAIAIRLPGERVQIVAEPDAALPLWDELAVRARPVGTSVWEWLEIRAGIPVITAATQDLFVPQMVNFELVGGVSFEKGCYPGQEIVARTHYLGKSKRRMYLAHVDCQAAPAPGSGLYSRDLENQASGTVVNAAAAPGGGFDVLAVIQTASAESQPIHLGAPDGPVLGFEPLPYRVP